MPVSMRAIPSSCSATVWTRLQKNKRMVAVRAQTDNLSRHFAQIGAELDAVLEKLKAPQQKTRSPEPKPQKVELADEQVLFCDENGCVLLDKSAKQGAGAAAQAQSSSSELDSLLSGHGWVLGVSADTDPEAAMPLFGAVVGGNGWTVSLTQAELQDFIKALQSIRRTVRDMLLQGINPSAGTAPVKVKWESNALSMEATSRGTAADVDHFELSFRVGAGRAVHATWAADVVGEVLDALDLHSYGLGNGQLKPQEAAIV